MPNTSLQAMYWALRGFLIFNMAKGFLGVSHAGNGSVDYYGRDNECLGWRHYDRDVQTFDDVKETWRQIEQNEKLGNKDLGIRGRHDARVRTNYILSLPNNLSPKECADRVEKVIQKTGIKNCPYTMFLHRGEKDGIKNFHMHLIVNERDLTTGKKDREQNKKTFIQDVLKPLYQKEFSVEFEKAPNYALRERIPMELYQSDTREAKKVLEGIYEISKGQLNEDRTLPTGKEISSMGLDERRLWNLYEREMQRAERQGKQFDLSWKLFKNEAQKGIKRGRPTL